MSLCSSSMMAGNMNGVALIVKPTHVQVCPSSHLTNPMRSSSRDAEHRYSATAVNRLEIAKPCIVNELTFGSSLALGDGQLKRRHPMIILLVVLTFATAIFVDHLLLRRTLVVLSGEPTTTPEPARPRLAPAVVAGFNLPDNLRYH